jgi:hypothetical protein
LAVCYEKGDGVVKDAIEAYARYKIAWEVTDLARKNFATLEKKITREARLKGLARAKEIQEEIIKNRKKKAGK